MDRTINRRNEPHTVDLLNVQGRKKLLVAVLTATWLLIGTNTHLHAAVDGKNLECPKTEADNLERSVEVRWFLKGSAPEEVKKWFITEPTTDILGGPMKPADPRTDHYLLAFEGPHISPKFREGKVEVKVLGKSKDVSVINGQVVGKIEEWLKWNWRYTCENTKAGQGLDEKIGRGIATWTDERLQVEVRKERAERRFQKQSDGSFQPVAKIPKNGSGVKAEVTELQIAKELWWTVAVEVLGKDSSPFETLQQGMTFVFKEYPDGLQLTKETSMSYPEWLSRRTIE
jgi:hypothetical protein